MEFWFMAPYINPGNVFITNVMHKILVYLHIIH